MSDVLRALGLRKTFKNVEAVQGIDVVVRAGERVGLLGPNGAGKTTTLLMVLGAILPDHGTIEIAGHSLPRHRSKAMANVGFVAGYLPLPDRLKVREALGVFAGWYGMRNEKQLVADGLERFGIGHLGDRLCSALSSGQRTLVGIVKATLHEPPLLVLDEPTSGMDPIQVKQLRSHLTAAARDRAILVSSHAVADLEALASRVAVLRAGELIALATPRALCAQTGAAKLEDAVIALLGEAAADGRAT